VANTRYVYFFGDGKSDGTAEMKNLLGGKGANLCEMTNLGIPVPSGFAITTEVCTFYYDNEKSYPPELDKQVIAALADVEKVMDGKFGDPSNPLLFSVRSGSRVSMPGMMDTVLNLGLNKETIAGMIKKTGNERFVWDAYRRFIQMYSDVVMGINDGKNVDVFEEAFDEYKDKKGYDSDLAMENEDLKALCEIYRGLVDKHLGRSFPDDPMEQLWGAIGAVFGSWNIPRAKTYRRLNGIPEHWGTAVNVQAMVFGNMGDDSATGVAFTRDPATGKNQFYGEFLINAQGEDVVAGIRTPQSINIAGKVGSDALPSLEEEMPKLYQELVDIYLKLEKHYREMQDIEFTIQQDKLWMLQTRTGKRTTHAALKIAVDMVEEGLIDKKTAILRIDPNSLDQMLHKQFDTKAERKPIATGLPASPGAAVGEVVFTADEAEALVEKYPDKKIILVRLETSPEDIHGMHAAQGILTARGGMTSHAAVVARGMGTCCVCGVSAIKIDYAKKQFSVADGTVVKQGDILSLDGATGEVMVGELPVTDPELTGDFRVLMGWADEVRRLKVRTNADSPHDSVIARDLGAQGIGLCRTEHMFFDDERITAMREMILSTEKVDREKALAKLLPFQKGDFKGIFKAMDGLPVNIRLLDPPLHEFLPTAEKDFVRISKEMSIDVEVLKDVAHGLHEFNPMLGHRGCRLAISYPEIYDMQVRAIMEAACEITRDEKVVAIPEIMIPFVSHAGELKIMRESALKICMQVIEETGQEIEYTIGTMIELPRACITADEVAKHADFFSFGTNDLTQTAFGLSRDDAGKFLPDYVKQNVLPIDPFVAIDRDGVGSLMRMGVEKGRAARHDLKVGICGEHGGEPTSIEFCHLIGLDYVSCSPYRVPIARLAAAQAALKH
jgi:pyruvate, orthophosphate dikinase